ncbi:hypothetical protein ACO2Q8_04070 [Larkinella sp. VNQ87]|uniref:hypothetical protein n=1 Tax=Larkinella sp. VNQ87 TaxID=3400921 RepID=UPI003C072F7B
MNRTNTSAPRTNAQNARFHVLLTQRKFDREEKAELVKFYTNGRSTSSSEMTIREMQEAIEHLEGLELASIKRMRSKVIHIAKDIFGVTEMHQEDWDNLNTFLLKTFKKKLNELDYRQLQNAVTAIERWRDSETRKMVKRLL